MALKQTEQDTGYGWFVTIVLCLCFTCSYMDRSILPLLAQPLELSLGLSDTTFALLQGAGFTVFYALFTFPLARLSDRGNRRNIILVGLIAWCIATAACGLTRTVPQLFVGRVCVAVGEAVIIPASVSILADYFSLRRRTRALSVHSMGAFFGPGLAFGVGGSLIRHFGADALIVTPIGALETWRVVFIYTGLAGLALVPFVLAIREPDRRSDDGRRDKAAIGYPELLAIFRQRRAALGGCIVGFATMTLGAHAVAAWTPSLFVRAHGWTLAAAGQAIGGLFLLLSPLGVLTGAFLADRLEARGHRDGKLRVGTISSLGCAVGAVLMTLASARLALFGTAMVLFVVAFNFGLLQAALTELLPNRARAFGSACYSIVSNLVAASMGPLLVGLLNDHVFHDPGMIAVSMRIVVPVSFLLAAAILFWGMKPFRLATAHLTPFSAAR